MLSEFRWLVDLSVIQAFESKTLELHDFYFTGDDYRYRFELEAKRRFINLLREQFNSGVIYGGKRLMWDTVMLRKCQELAQYLLKKTRSVNFVNPEAILRRSDTRELRKKILAMSQSEAHKRGIGKSTLHYLRNHARELPSFRVYSKVSRKIEYLS